MHPWQERVLEEKKDLEGKIERLHTFMATQEYADLDTFDQCNLTDQYNAMRSYFDALVARIERFD